MEEKKNDLTTENQNKTNNQSPEQTITIAPTNMNEEEMTREEHKRDISAIIPEFETTKTADQINLESKDKQLKSDGAVIIGNIVDDVYNYIPDSKLPEKIDIKARKAFLKKNKDLKMNISEVDMNIVKAKQKKMLNITSTMSLVIIGVLVLAFFVYKNTPKESDFKALPVTVELGDSLPTTKAKYIKPGIGNEVNELEYTIDTSSVVIDKVGEYQYTVTHNGKTKAGIIKIVDTTAPELETRNLVIKQGDTFEASSFVVKCTDLSGCNYSFEEANTTSKYTEPGNYVVVLAAEDAYGNKTIKQENLVIEQLGYVKNFKKTLDYDFNTNSQVTELYEIHFTDYFSSTEILRGKHTTITTYKDDESYQVARKEHYGEANYTLDDEKKTITYVEEANTVGPYYSKYDQVMSWFSDNGFEEIDD